MVTSLGRGRLDQRYGHKYSTSTVSGNYGVFVTGTNSTIKSTGSGGVALTGTGGGSGTGGNDYGVTWSVANGIQSTGGGAITITGTGGDSLGTLAADTGSNNYGVFISQALSGSGGAILITGTGGNSSGTGNYGIDQTAAITNTGAGNITLAGTGGGTGKSAVMSRTLMSPQAGVTFPLPARAARLWAGRAAAASFSRVGPFPRLAPAL